MYLVVTTWEPLAGHEQEFQSAGMRVGSVLRRQPGVRMLEVFRSGGNVVIAHGYEDEETYRRLIHDPGGVFAKAHAENRVEDHARLIGSIGGECMPVP